MKKKIALLMAVVMLFGVVVGGTFAWLSAGTTMVRNTFEVGKVNITLNEAPVDKYGEVTSTAEADRVKANTYKLIPGHEYTKDPRVTVLAGSEPSWVFIKVENGLSAIMPDDCLEAQILANGWTALEGQTGVFYKENVDARNADVKLQVFGTFTLTDGAAVENYTGAEITIDAYAVQDEGLDTVSDAWATVTWGD